MFLAAGASGICAGSYGSCSVWRGVLIGPLAWFGGGGRESPGRRGTFLCFAKEKYPKERRPHCLRPLRFAPGQPAVLGFGGVSLELAPFHCAQTIASPDPPNPALLGASRGARGAKHPHGPSLRSAPPRGRKRHALRRPGRASDGPNGCPAVWMFGCPPLLAAPAAGRLRGGTRVGARVLRALTRRGCPSGAAQQHSEFHGALRNRHDAGLPLRTAKGSQTGGRLFFGDFLLAKQKKVTRMPGDSRPPP